MSKVNKWTVLYFLVAIPIATCALVYAQLQSVKSQDGLQIIDCNFDDNCSIELGILPGTDYELVLIPEPNVAEDNAYSLTFIWDGNEVELVPGPNGVTMTGDDIPRVIYNSCIEMMNHRAEQQKFEHEYRLSMHRMLEDLKKTLK